MTKFRNDQTGSVMIVGLAVLMVALLSGVGFMVYHDQTKPATAATKKLATTATAAKAAPTTAATPSATAGKAAPTTTTSTFKVPELGIQISNIPTDLSDVNYAITSGDAAGSGADFSTLKLSQLDASCAPTGVFADGNLASNKGTHSSNPSDAVDNVAFVKQFPGFWISYTHPDACSDVASTEALHVAQTASFQTWVTNPANLSAIQ